MQFSKISIGYLQYQAALSISAASVSAIMGAAGVFGLLFGIFVSEFTSRLNTVHVLIWSLLAASVMSFAQAILPSFTLFYVLRLIEGASNLFIVIAAPTLIAHIAPRKQVSLAMGLWGTFYDVGFAATGVAGPFLLEEGGIRLLLISHGLLSLLLALAVKFRIKPVTSYSRSPIVTRFAVLAVFRLHKAAYGRAKTALPGLMFFFISLLYLGFVLFIPLSVSDKQTRNIISTTLPIMSILGALLSGPIGKSQFGPARAIAVGFPALGCFAACLYVTSIYINGTGLYVGIANILAFNSGILQGSIFVLVTRLARSAPEEATSFGVIAQLGSLGSIVGPVAFAVAIDQLHFVGFILLVAVAVGLVVPLSLLSVRAYKESETLFLARGEMQSLG